MNKALVASFGMLFVLSMLMPPVAHASFLDDLRAQLGALRIQLDELIQKSEMLKAPSASPSTPYSNAASTGSIVRSPSVSLPQSGRFIVLEELPDSPQVACSLPELSSSERKNAVYLLQIALYKAGYYKDGFITGYYGKLTEAAVRKFQSERGLSPTGRLDRSSAAALSAYVKEYFEECRGESDAKPILEVPSSPATSSRFEPPLPPIILPPVVVPPVATSTPPAATSTRTHGPSVWNYGWDDFTSPLGADHAAQILENYKAHPEEYGVNPIGNNGYIPNPVLYGTSSPSMPSAVLRLYKACGDHWINRKEYIPVASGGYMNYRCTNRYEQQCIDDGSFDSYYDEACIYENLSPSASSGTDLYSASLLNAATHELNYMVGQLKALIGEER